MRSMPAPSPPAGGFIRWPGVYIPTLYFAEGLPYALVNLVSVPLLKGLGASNELIGLSSFLYLPWALKGLWGPLVDRIGSRRGWILWMQALLAALSGGLSLALLGQSPALLAIVAFIPIAFASATHDIAADGFYLDVLDPPRQALYVGIRSAAYKVALLAGQGGLVILAGALERPLGSLGTAWALAIATTGMAFGLLALFHSRALPRPASGPPLEGARGGFAEAFQSYFRRPRMGFIALFILLYRLGDALMLKMAQPFLMEAKAHPGAAAWREAYAGLGLSTEQIGLIYGTVGMLFSLLGGLLGGYLLTRGGLRRWLWPLAVVQNSFIALYWLLAIVRPGIGWVMVVNSIEQLGYGLGVSALSVLLMRTVQPEHRAAHYAIGTSIMAVGMMLPGAVSGYLQQAFGYADFFLASLVLSIPGMLVLTVLPIKELDR